MIAKIMVTHIHAYQVINFLTHSYLEIRKGLQANSADSDQMPHNVASDQGLHCLLTGSSIEE